MNGNVAPPLSVRSVSKALLALSGASVVRTFRCGLTAGKQSLVDSYSAVDPFSEGERHRMLAARIPVRPLREL